MKKIIYIIAVIFSISSCTDFLETAPQDSFSTSTYPKSEKDLQMLAIGCYDGWTSTAWVLESDATTDNMYDGFPWEGWSIIQEGGLSSSNAGNSEGLYSSAYTTITKCNNFLVQAENVEFSNDEAKSELISEIRFIRAWRYFQLTMGWGDVPLFTKPFKTVEEAKVPRETADKVEKFINTELDEIIPLLSINSEKGRISRGAALALKMRFNLYKAHFEEVVSAAQAIQDLEVYTIYDNYSDLFLAKGEGNSETILAYQYLDENYSNWLTNILPNGDGGWSSIVPIQSLVDAYETTNGLTINEDPSYDASTPWFNRDSRLRATVLYSGRTWSNLNGDTRVYNAIDKMLNGINNEDYRYNKGNSTKSGYNFIKWSSDLTQIADTWNIGVDVYIFRYAEVLLSKAEAMIELNTINDDLYNIIDQVRTRAKMPKVDRTKYSNQASLRKLIRRERRVEFAGEGLRRDDIIRWDIAKEVMNNKINACVGTVIDINNPIEELRVEMGTPASIVENKFAEHNKLYPFAQSFLDSNKKLTQNKGY